MRVTGRLADVPAEATGVVENMEGEWMAGLEGLLTMGDEPVVAADLTGWSLVWAGFGPAMDFGGIVALFCSVRGQRVST